MVIAGEEIIDISEGTTSNRRTTNKTLSTRRRSRKQQLQSSFRFMKNPATASDVGVDGVLQVKYLNYQTVTKVLSLCD